jgi:N-methylhydantoinase B
MPSKVPYHKARAGDRLIACGPSGGGYGHPRKRSPEAVLDDVLDGYIGEEVAHALYGVVIRKGAIDQEKTDQLRKGKT